MTKNVEIMIKTHAEIWTHGCAGGCVLVTDTPASALSPANQVAAVRSSRTS